MYRVFRSGVAIECDSAADVAGLLAVFTPAELPSPTTTVPDDALRNGPRWVPRRQPCRRGVKSRAAKPTSISTSTPKPSGDSSEAAERRTVLLDLIYRSAVGLTGGELVTRTPKMSSQDRRNALSTLKAKGEIRRAGNTWVYSGPVTE